MKCIRIQRLDGVNTAIEIIPEFDPIFPDVPITERYSEEFLNGCVVVDDSVEVRIGWIYDGDTFTKPDGAAPEEGETLNWVVGEAVKVGDLRMYTATTGGVDVKYECVHAHTTKTGWEPSKFPTMWKAVI